MRIASVLRLLLALAVALTTSHAAIGRAQAQGAVTVEICADGATTTITLDSHGQPVRQAFACPDCVLGGLALAASPPLATRAPRRRAARLSRPRPGPAPTCRRLPRPRSRAPPAAA